MDIWIMDTSFQVVEVLDTYKSFIWTDRYCGYGDFEIYAPANESLMAALQEDYYLWIKDSNRTMIIEGIEIDTDVEDGAFVIITGRSLESILERRVIWGQTILNGSLQACVQRLLNENVISPSISARRISGFAFKSSSDTAVTSLELSAQYFGENLYDTIVAICESFNLGFRVLLDINAKTMRFELYSGADRSYSQVMNPHIIFSPDFENLLSSNYFKSKKAWKNAAMVAGEGEGADRMIVNVTSDGSTGLNRREIYADAGAISKTIESDGEEEVDPDTGEPIVNELSDAEYSAQLAQRGKEDLAKTSVTESFEGEIAPITGYTYGSDFLLGDIVEILNEFGHGAKVRVSEVIISHDESGSNIVPTFSVVA